MRIFLALAVSIFKLVFHAGESAFTEDMAFVVEKVIALKSRTVVVVGFGIDVGTAVFVLYPSSTIVSSIFADR